MRNLHITMTPFRNESRVLRETQSLARHGVFDEISIVAMHEGELAEHETIDASRAVWRVALRTRAWPRNLLVQLMKYVELCWRVWTYSRRSHFRVVNVHSLALLPLGVLLKATLGMRLVYDAHELETETNGLRGLRKWLSKIVERRCIRFADLVIVVSDGIRNWYREAYGLQAMVTVLNSPTMRAPKRSSLLRDALGIATGRLIALYQGGLSTGRGIEALLDAFEAHPDLDMDLVFLGYGELELRIREVMERDRRIHFHPAVSPNEVLEYTASADIGVALIEGTCVSYHWCLPNKLFEYTMAGLVVIVSDLPEMARVVRDYGVGVVVVDSGPDAVVSALRQAASLDRAALGANLTRCSADHSWECQEQVMIEAYRRYVS
jgi:glycosyltransferase involved in cell wall biosynthesis